MVELAGLAAGGGGHVPFHIWSRGQPKWSPNLGGGGRESPGGRTPRRHPHPAWKRLLPAPSQPGNPRGPRGSAQPRWEAGGGSAGGSRPAPRGGVKGSLFPRRALQVSRRSWCSPARAAGDGGKCGVHPGSRGGACLRFVCLFVCCVASPLF